MSRSCKHTPRCGDRKGKYSKRCANRIVRHTKSEDCFPQYGGYKKMFESWNICDFEIKATTFERYYADLIQWSVRDGTPFPNRAHSRNQYRKLFLQK